MTGATILGIGTAAPAERVTQHDALELARQLVPYRDQVARLLPALYRRSGVETRHVVIDPTTGAPLVAAACPDDSAGTAVRLRAYEAAAPLLAARAALRALAHARLEGNAITHLVTVSCTGAAAPGVDIHLIELLGLRSTVARAHLGFQGCYGALAGLRVAAAFAREENARVLLVAVELCSLHFHSGDDPEHIFANAIFADGAGAVVLADTENGVRLRAQYSALFPGSLDLMSWKIGDHGFEMDLSPRVPAVIEEHLRASLEEWLATLGLSVAAIPTWAIHPGGPRILDAAEGALGLEPSATHASRDVLRQFGNMSSPTVLFILERLLRDDAASPIVALGFGPGLVVEAALFDRKEER
jgi:predicted naringenin-chalcone synthase